MAVPGQKDAGCICPSNSFLANWLCFAAPSIVACARSPDLHLRPSAVSTPNQKKDRSGSIVMLLAKKTPGDNRALPKSHIQSAYDKNLKSCEALLNTSTLATSFPDVQVADESAKGHSKAFWRNQPARGQPGRPADHW
jgi:hypothetical protein